MWGVRHNSSLSVRLFGSRKERGGVVIEFVVLAPLIILALGFVMWLSAQQGANAYVLHTAQDAARQAALSVEPSEAHRVISQLNRRLVQQRLSEQDHFCDLVNVAVDTGEWDDGWVSATVSCTPASNSVFPVSQITKTWYEPVFRSRLLGR